jgi:hypothetical protein
MRVQRIAVITSLGLLCAAGAVQAAETYSATILSAGAGAVTDRRPIPIGLYDASVNKTWVTWMGGGNSIAIIKEYDHNTNTWGANKTVGSSFSDKHNYPGLVKGADNRLYVFHGCHNSPLKMSKSPNPLSAAGTWTDRSISQAPKASYPAPVVTSNGTIYVGHRHTRQSNGHTDDRPYAFVKSTDNGATWTSQIVIDPYPRSDNLTEIYNGKVTYEPAHGGQKAKIHVAWTLAGGGPGSHAHATYGRSVYYAYLDPTNDRMYSAAGVDLGPTITNSEMEANCKVLETGCSNCGHQAALQVSAHYLDNGNPIIIYSHLNNGFSSSVWNGSAWVKRVITTAEGEPRDLFKFGPSQFKAFRGSGNTCQYYRTMDGGLSWSLEGSVTAPHSADRCNVIVNHHPDLKLFMEERAAGGDTSVARVTSGFEPWYEVGAGPVPTSTPTPTTTPIATPTPTPTPTGTGTEVTPTPTPTPTLPPGDPVEITPPGSGVTASTNDGNAPANAVDANLTTRWSGNGDGAWLRLDLGTEKTISYVTIGWYSGNTRRSRFDLQWSNDNTNWNAILTGVESNGTTTNEVMFEFPDVSARWLRYVGHGNNEAAKSTWNSVAEISVWQTGASPVPTATPTPTPQSGVVAFSPEAETLSLSAPMTTGSDAGASGGGFIQVTAGNNSAAAAPATGHATFSFTLVDSGTFKVWGRVMTPVDTDDSFWVRMDSGAWINWNNISLGAAWHWDDVHNAASGNSVTTWFLAPGTHTLTVAYREDGAKLDRLLITNDLAAVPSGVGP